jgi:hypothetical protein
MTDDKQERDGPRHDLNVDHSYNFEGVKVKSLSDGCALNTLRQPQTDRLSKYQQGFNSGVEESAKALEADAKLCDCAAREERECGCGAWCEWKSITSARAIEIVRALVKETLFS